MKKWGIAFLILIILLLGGAYFYIPQKLSIAKANLIRANQNSIIRFFSKEANFTKWQGGNSQDFLIDSPEAFFYNGVHFLVTKKTTDGLEILLKNEDLHVDSKLTFYPIINDSTALEWKCEMDGGNNIFTRIANYKRALYVKNNFAFLLKKLQLFLEKEKNVYGVDIQHEFINDTLVIAQKADFQHYPSTNDLYPMINELKTYAIQNNIVITNPPMMNVSFIDNVYHTMVAVPISKTVKNTEKIILKHLTPGTPMLSAIVNGGDYTTQQTLSILEDYKMDHQSTSPAIPYNILLTDRDKETDTTKWRTKVCDLLFPWFK